MSGCIPPAGGPPGHAPSVGGSPPPAASSSVPAAPRSLRSAALAVGESIQSGIVCCSPWSSTLPKLVRVSHLPSLPCLMACSRVLLSCVSLCINLSCLGACTSSTRETNCPQVHIGHMSRSVGACWALPWLCLGASSAPGTSLAGPAPGVVPLPPPRFPTLPRWRPACLAS